MFFLIIGVIFVMTLFAGIPIAFSIGLCSFGGVLMMGDIPLHLMAIRVLKGIDSFPLLAIPFFVLAGDIMAKGGVTERLVKFSDIFVGKIAGGLAQSAIVASMIFAGITGSATADASGIGAVLVPAMNEKKYDLDFSCPVMASSAGIGAMLPP